MVVLGSESVTATRTGTDARMQYRGVLVHRLNRQLVIFREGFEA